MNLGVTHGLAAILLHFTSLWAPEIEIQEAATVLILGIFFYQAKFKMAAKIQAKWSDSIICPWVPEWHPSDLETRVSWP